MSGSQINKTIWIYWHQGVRDLPYLVRQCIRSWELYNPAWVVRLLDKDDVKGELDLNGLDTRQDIGLQALTDIIRVELLSKYGGVWVDATLFCDQALDTWLLDGMNDSFFAFSSEKNDRLMTTWFLAHGDGSRLLSTWREEILRYWHNHEFLPVSYWRKQVLRKLASLRKRGVVSNSIWFSWFVLRWLKVYPYPINMYLFELAIAKKQELLSLWYKGDYASDFAPEKINNIFGMNTNLTEASRAFIDSGVTPVHKLNWRSDPGESLPETNLGYLFSRLDKMVETR